jgi:Phage tail lysozyme
MRFSEFQITEAEQSKFYTVGDSHAHGIAANSKGWINLAKDGAKTTDPMHLSAIDKIPEGSTVAISLGHNDSAGSNDTPQQIASNVANVVNRALARKLKVYFILFPSGNNQQLTKRNNEVRSAINSAVGSKVTLLDLNRGSLGADGIHDAPGEYTQLGNYITKGNNSLNIKGGAGKGATVSPSQVSSYLKSKGLDNIHILGILANIQGESGFNAGVLGDGNTSGGLFQHHADRFSNMVNAVGSDWRSDWQGQIDFALSEPAGQKYVRINFPSAAAATEWWVRNFEKPKYADADVAKRIGFLRNYA